MNTIDITKATADEVLAFVTAHLLWQNARSITADENGRICCAYRSHDGLQCAAGCLLTNEMYGPSMEGSSWEALVDEGRVPPNHRDLIERLQYIHDKEDVDNWPRELTDLARSGQFGLTGKPT